MFRLQYLVFKRKRRETLCRLAIVCLLFWFTYKLTANLNSNYACWQLKQSALLEICHSFNRHKSVGTLCYDLCISKNVILLDCPNIDGHDGKDYVFSALWNLSKIVIKARKLKRTALLSASKEPNFDDNILQQSIKDTFAVTFNHSSKFLVESLIPWSVPANQTLRDLNSSSLSNIWFLCQDNEYILSKVLGDSWPTSVFPRVVATCGHFYATEYAPQILNFSYVTAHQLWRETFTSRVEVSVMLINFLKTIEDSQVRLELCDVKLDHFGVFDGSRVVMIDSDMIYHTKIVNEVITAIGKCETHSDCDFIDCQGKCVTGKCTVNYGDNNLKRICRNMLFMGELQVLGYEHRYGLLANYPLRNKDDINLIKQLCFQDTVNNDLTLKINKMLQLLKQLQES